MKISIREEKDKEVFRFWYECLLRTCTYWDLYYIYEKGMIDRARGKSPDLFLHADGILADDIPTTGRKKAAFDMICSMMSMIGFFEAQDIGFDDAWKNIKDPKYFNHSTRYEDVEDMALIMGDNIQTSIEEYMRFTAFSGSPDDFGPLRLFKNIQVGPSQYGKEWSLLTGFEIEYSHIKEFVLSQPIFSSKSMRINLSIYPFGKTKKEILDEVWNSISKFKLDKKKYARHLNDTARWMRPCSEFRKDEIKRYLGVFDLVNMGKNNKDILRGDYEDYDSDFIKAVRVFYTNRVQSQFDASSKDAHRMLTRDLKKAKAMIANALNGYFPKYPKN